MIKFYILLYITLLRKHSPRGYSNRKGGETLRKELEELKNCFSMQTKSSLNRVTPTSIGCHPSNEARSTKPTERVRHKVRSRTDITQAFLPIQTESMTSYAESDHPAPGKRGVWMPSPCSSKNPSTDVNHPLIGPQQAASRVDFGGRLQHPRGEILTLDGKMSLETHRHMERQAERAPCNMASPSTLAIPTSIDIYTCWAFAVEVILLCLGSSCQSSGGPASCSNRRPRSSTRLAPPCFETLL